MDEQLTGQEKSAAEATATAETTAATEEVKGQPAPVLDVTQTKEYKGLQTRLNRANEELARARARDASIATIEQKIQKVVDAQGLIIEALGSAGQEVQAPTPTNLRQRYDALNAKPEAPQTTPEQVYEYRTLTRLTRKAKLEPDSDEVIKTRHLYQTQGFEAAEDYLEGLIDKGKAPRETEEEMEARIERRLLNKMGVNSVDNSTSGSKKGSRKPTIEEFKKTPPKDALAKLKSGEWTLS